MKITISKKEAGLFLDDKGKATLYLPKDDEMPDYVQLIACIGILIKRDDRQFINYVFKRWETILRDDKARPDKNSM
jgi:hypothetical protein